MAIDPRVSEWGNPVPGRGIIPRKREANPEN